MNKVTVAYDVDGTLRNNSEERHKVDIEQNPRQIELLKALAHSKNVEIHLWSNRGAEYCRQIRKIFNLEKFVKEKNCHLKEWKSMQEVEVVGFEGNYKALRADAFRPDIAFDDQHGFSINGGAKIAIIVDEKDRPKND